MSADRKYKRGFGVTSEYGCYVKRLREAPAAGFTYTGLDTPELERRLAIMKQLRKEAGREHEAFEIYAGVSDVRGLDDLRRIEDLGVDAIFIGYRNPYQPETMTLQQKLDAVKMLGETVIGNYRPLDSPRSRPYTTPTCRSESTEHLLQLGVAASSGYPITPPNLEAREACAAWQPRAYCY